MKHLKIEKGKGYYCLNESDDYQEIDKINKDDLMSLIDKAVGDEDFEMDEFKKEDIENKAHQIIYKNLYEKFSELHENRNRFKDESEQLYKDALERYRREGKIDKEDKKSEEEKR